VIAECHQGGEEFKDDSGVDEVDFFPYRVRNPVRAGGRGWGGLGKGESDFFRCERGGREVFIEAAPAGQGVFGREEMVQ